MRISESKKSFLEKVASALIGFFWALVVIFALVGFRALYSYGTVAAIISAFFCIIPPLLLIIFLEHLILKIKIHEEQKKQTLLLEKLLEQRSS